MNQGDLIEKVANAASISKAEAERAINAMKEAITDSLRRNTNMVATASVSKMTAPNMATSVKTSK